MNPQTKAPAFTLIEMVIAITVFSIFMAFVMGSYLVFHRSNQEALTYRGLILETQWAMDFITDALRNNAISFDYYLVESGATSDALTPFSDGDVDPIVTSTLVLVSPDGVSFTHYVWDEDAQTLTVQQFDEDGSPLDGYSDPILLHAEATKVSFVRFTLFPPANPYALENAAEDDLQYQPIVQVQLTFSLPGRMREMLHFPLQTSVTSRLYQ